MQQQDPLTAKAEELRAASEEFEAELDQLQAVSEGRLDTAISTLRAPASTPSDRQRSTTRRPTPSRRLARSWRTSMEDLAEAWAVLDQRVDVQCDAD